MALIQCSECGKDVSDKAPACIHCGNPLDGLIEMPVASFSITPPPDEKQKLGPVGKFGIGVILLMLTVLLLANHFTNKTYSSSDSNSSQTITETPSDAPPADDVAAKEAAHAAAAQQAQAEKDKKCRQDLQCWSEKNTASATTACQPEIEKQAKFDFQWTDGFLEGKFDKISWADKKNGSVTYMGHKVKFQNGFGAWQIEQYFCTYDPATKKASDIVVMPRSDLQ